MNILMTNERTIFGQKLGSFRPKIKIANERSLFGLSYGEAAICPPKLATGARAGAKVFPSTSFLVSEWVPEIVMTTVRPGSSPKILSVDMSIESIEWISAYYVTDTELRDEENG